MKFLRSCEISQQQHNLVEVRNFVEGYDGFWPPTSNDHNFLVQTLFQVFLDSMESPLSQEYSHAPMEGNWCSQLFGKLMLYQVCKLLGCVDARSYVLTWPLHGMV